MKHVVETGSKGGTGPYSDLRIQFQHTIGTNREMKSYVMLSENNYRGPYVYNAGINFVTGKSSWGEANEHGRYRAYDILSDFTGKYDLFGIPNRSTLGYTAAKTDNRYPNLVTYPGVTTSWTNIPFNQPMQGVVAPIPTNAQNYQSGWGGPTDNEIDFTSYFQQEIDILPDRLSVVGGGSGLPGIRLTVSVGPRRGIELREAEMAGWPCGWVSAS